MGDSKERFLDAATRPFANQAELGVAVRDWLEDQVPADDPRLDEAAKRWDQVDGKSGRLMGKWALFGMVVLAIFVVGIFSLKDTWSHLRAARILITEEFGEDTVARERILSKLTEPQTLLFPGKEPGRSALVANERLWKNTPENPAYFAEYVRSFTREQGHPPEDFLETARKLDADNSWFTYFAADQMAKGAFEQNADQSWKILDQARFGQAVALLRETRGQKVCESYGAEMLVLRTEALPSGGFSESFDGVIVLASVHMSSFQILMNVPFVLSAQSWMAAESRDIEAFREVSQDAARFLANVSSLRVETMLSEVITFGVAMSVSTRLSADAERLGLAAEAEHWKGVLERLRGNKKARSSGKFLLEGREEDPVEFESILLHNTFEVGLMAVKHPPALGKMDLKPGWMVDHFFASRISSYVIGAIMALCLVAVALYRLRVGGVPGAISRRGVDLLDWKDWAWILGPGVFLPFAYVMVIVFTTPLGGHHSGLKGTGMLLPFGPFLGLCLLWITLPAQIAGWRLGKRAGALGFSKPGWFGWVAVGAAAAFVPAVGCAAISHSFTGFWRDWLFECYLEIIRSSVSPVSFWIAFGLAVGILLVVLGRTSLAIFSRPDRIIPPSAVSMVLTRVFPLALLLTTLAIPVFQGYGQYWFVRDELVNRDPALPGWTGYEARVAHQARKELREALGL